MFNLFPFFIYFTNHSHGDNSVTVSYNKPCAFWRRHGRIQPTRGRILIYIEKFTTIKLNPLPPIGFFSPKLQGALIAQSKWIGGIVPYQIDAVLSEYILLKVFLCNTAADDKIVHVVFFIKADEEKGIFQAALDGYANKTCIKFKKRTCQKDYISIQKLDGYVHL